MNCNLVKSLICVVVFVQCHIKIWLQILRVR